MTVILLIRHGENDWVGKKLAGRLPGVHLNKNGQQQAETIAEVLAEAPIQAIYSSPLERTVETATPLAKKINLPIIQESNLQEINFGDWQGKSIKQLSRRKLWKTVQEKPAEMVFPNGESFSAAQTRLAECLQTLSQQHQENDLIACFSHSDSIRLLVAYSLNMHLNDFQRIAIHPASVTVIHLTDTFIRIPFINQIITQDFSSLFIQPEKNEKKHD